MCPDVCTIWTWPRKSKSCGLDIIVPDMVHSSSVWHLCAIWFLFILWWQILMPSAIALIDKYRQRIVEHRRPDNQAFVCFAVWLHQQLPQISGDGELWAGDLGQTEVWPLVSHVQYSRPWLLSTRVTRCVYTVSVALSQESRTPSWRIRSMTTSSPSAWWRRPVHCWVRTMTKTRNKQLYIVEIILCG